MLFTGFISSLRTKDGLLVLSEQQLLFKTLKGASLLYWTPCLLYQINNVSFVLYKQQLFFSRRVTCKQDT